MPIENLSTLPFDCLRFVFDKVSTRDLLHLRETVRPLRTAIINYLDLYFLPRVGFPNAEESDGQWHLGWMVNAGPPNRRMSGLLPTAVERPEQSIPLQKSQDFQVPHSPAPIWLGLRTVRAAQIFLLTADIVERRIRLIWREWDHHRPNNRRNDWASSRMNLLFHWVFFQCSPYPSEPILGLLCHPSIRQNENFHILPLADFIVRGWRVFPEPITLTYAIADPVTVGADIDSRGVSLHALLTGVRALSPPSTFSFLTDMIERNDSWVCTFGDFPADYLQSHDQFYSRPQLDLHCAPPPGQSRMFVLVHCFATGGLNERRCEIVGCYADIEAAGEAMLEYGIAATTASTEFTYRDATQQNPSRRLPQGYDYHGEVWMQIRLYPVGAPPTRRFNDPVVWERKWFQDEREEVERRWDKVEGGAAGEVEVERLYEAMRRWTV